MEQTSPAASREKPRLSLHHLSAMTLSPLELIRAAHRTGCEHVCLFVDVPDPVRDRYPVVGPGDVATLREAMSETGVSVYNVEVFPLFADTESATFRQALRLAQSLGACQATVHIHCPDRTLARTRLLELSRIAEDFGMELGLEFNAFSSVRSPSEALEMLKAIRLPGLTIVADLLHIVRSGEGLAAVQAISPHVTYAQMCDGPLLIAAEARWREALSDRLAPGVGEFPLNDLIIALPNVRVWDIEVPERSANRTGQDIFERIDRLVAATRRVLADSMHPS